MSPANVLYCEPNDELRLIAAEALTEAGYTVTACATHAQSLLLLERAAPHCLLLDVSCSPEAIPGSALDALVRLSRHRKLELVLTSGRLDLPAIAIACAVQRFLVKPYELEHLLRIVREACGG